MFQSISDGIDLNKDAEVVIREAFSFFHQLAEPDIGLYTSAEARKRYEQVLAEIETNCIDLNKDLNSQFGGLWHPTSDELWAAGRLAWRNSNRCIGRLHWKSLHIMDRRHIESLNQAFEALLEHLAFATNGGKIRSVLSVFSNRITIHNPQLIRYAGFRNDDGSITGDPLLEEFTRFAMELGWKPAEKTPFTVLPVVLQLDDQTPVIFELPDDPQYVLEVPITHPEYDFTPLDLKWHALPVISNMDFAFGGLRYKTAPFNGFYMGTEIGARNFGDSHRYNKLSGVAMVMKLDTSTNASLWKDKALIELNLAVLHSFRKHRVKMVDHHTASDQYMTFCELEKKQNREVTGDWTWLVPPVSGSACPVFHEEWKDEIRLPNFLNRK